MRSTSAASVSGAVVLARPEESAEALVETVLGGDDRVRRLRGGPIAAGREALGERLVFVDDAAPADRPLALELGRQVVVVEDTVLERIDAGEQARRRSARVRRLAQLPAEENAVGLGRERVEGRRRRPREAVRAEPVGPAGVEHEDDDVRAPGRFDAGGRGRGALVSSTRGREREQEREGRLGRKESVHGLDRVDWIGWHESDNPDRARPAAPGGAELRSTPDDPTSRRRSRTAREPARPGRGERAVPLVTTG